MAVVLVASAALEPQKLEKKRRASTARTSKENPSASSCLCQAVCLGRYRVEPLTPSPHRLVVVEVLRGPEAPSNRNPALKAQISVLAAQARRHGLDVLVTDARREGLAALLGRPVHEVLGSQGQLRHSPSDKEALHCAPRPEHAYHGPAWNSSGWEAGLKLY